MIEARIPGFDHQALQLQPADVIFTAMSRHSFHLRIAISEYVLQQGKCPANPYMSFDFNFFGLIPKEQIITANNSLLVKSDQLWAFGPISDGMLAEILLFLQYDRPIKFYNMTSALAFEEIQPYDAEFESDIRHMRSRVLALLSQSRQDAIRDELGGQHRTIDGQMIPTLTSGIHAIKTSK